MYSVAYSFISLSFCPFSTVLIVVFGSADYQVPEGEAEQLMLTTNRPHSFSFTVNVTTQNRSAECECHPLQLACSIVRMYSMTNG